MIDRCVREPQVDSFPTILVVKDQEGLDALLIDCLQKYGFHVLEVEDRDRAIDVVKGHSRSIHLLLADVTMRVHEVNLRDHRPEMAVIYVDKPIVMKHLLSKVQ